MNDEKFTTMFICSVSGLIAYRWYQNRFQEVFSVRSRVDNRKYMVNQAKDQQDAADTLARIRAKLERFSKYIQKKYPEDERVIQLSRLFQPDAIVEAKPEEKTTSYTINKGEQMVLCIRSRDDKRKLIDENVLMFVALHELTHIMTESVGHTTEFWDNFSFVLREALKLGVYHYVDFRSNPVKYCGVEITDSPLTPEEAAQALTTGE